MSLCSELCNWLPSLCESDVDVENKVIITGFLYIIQCSSKNLATQTNRREHTTRDADINAMSKIHIYTHQTAFNWGCFEETVNQALNISINLVNKSRWCLCFGFGILLLRVSFLPFYGINSFCVWCLYIWGSQPQHLKHCDWDDADLRKLLVESKAVRRRSEELLIQIQTFSQVLKLPDI